MTAKEMFLQIGYTEEEDDDFVEYSGLHYSIKINKFNQAIWKESFDDEDASTTFVVYEIKAINKKIKELGW